MKKRFLKTSAMLGLLLGTCSAYNQTLQVNLQEENGGGLISWITDQTEVDAFGNGFNWIMGLMGLGGHNDAAQQIENSLADIQNQLSAIQTVVNNDNIILNDLTNAFWNFQDSQYQYDLSTELQSLLYNEPNVNAADIWTTISNAYGSDLSSLSLEDFAKKYYQDEVLHSNFSTPSSEDNWIFQANTAALNISSNDVVYKNMGAISKDYISSLKAGQTGVNLVSLINAYNTSYYRVQLYIMQNMQYAYNIQALGIALYYQDPKRYEAIKTFLGNDIIADNYADAINNLDEFFKTRYIAPLKNELANLQLPQTPEQMLADSYGLKLDAQLTQRCQIINFSPSGKSFSILMQAVCTQDLVNAAVGLGCSNVTYNNGIVSGSCKNANGQNVDSSLNYVQTCQYDKTPSLQVNQNGSLHCAYPYPTDKSVNLKPSKQIYIPTPNLISLDMNDFTYISGQTALVPQSVNWDDIWDQTPDSWDNMQYLNTPFKLRNCWVPPNSSVTLNGLNLLHFHKGSEQSLGENVTSAFEMSKSGINGQITVSKDSLGEGKNIEIHDWGYSLTPHGHLMVNELKTIYSLTYGGFTGSPDTLSGHTSYGQGCLKNDDCDMVDGGVFWHDDSDKVTSTLALGANLTYQGTPLPV